MTLLEEGADGLLAKQGLDAIVGYTRATLRHLSGVDFPVAGWGAEERTWVIWTPTSRILLSPDWFDPYVFDSVRDGIEVRFFAHPQWPVDALVSLLRDLGLGTATVGIEAEQLPMAVADALRREFPAIQLRGIDTELTQLRAAKTPDEAVHMLRASQALERGIADAIAASAVGITEREFAHRLCEAVVHHGADTVSWLALRWGDDALRMAFRDVPVTPEQLINIEIGCTVNGYFGDVQRMVAATPVRAEVSDAYRQLQATHHRTMLGIRPGMTSLGVYEMYLAQMRDAGLEDWSSYFLGHAIGLNPHEHHLLWAESDPTEIVPEGSFYSLEPAISTPVLISVEDTVHVTGAGNDIISSHGDWSELVVLGQRVEIPGAAG
ncbi:MAG: aminopeptidase P family protein [Kineosporiaceae bacterium]|nr:aminopeptidase P family protein [Kineosporiaceae bacterium]